MTNPILSGISNVIQSQNAQNQNVLGNFDLNDDKFSNILDSKIGKINENETNENSLIGQLGIPTGLNIEGFDYNNLINSTEKIDEINTESDIKNDGKFDTGSLLKDAASAFSPVVNSIINSEFSFNSEGSSNPVQAVKNFWGNQASNFYNIMNKDTVSNITELISKL